MILKKSENIIKYYFIEVPNYLSFFLFPLFMSTISPILIEMGKTFSVDPKDLNLLFFYFAIGNILGRFFLLLFRNKFKGLNIIIFSNVLLLIFNLILYFVNSLVIYYIIYCFFGYILGITVVIATEFLLESPVINKEKFITISTFFIPAGFITGFIVSSYMVKKGLEWKNIYLVLIFIVFISLLLYIFITKRRKYPDFDKNNNSIEIIEIFKNIKKYNIFFLLCFITFFYVNAEFIVSNWVPTFLRLERSFSVQLAGINASIFWSAIALGRIIASFITGRFNSYLIMLYFSICGLASTTLIIFSKSSYVIFISTVLIGLSLSVLWPLIIYSGSSLYKKYQSALTIMIFLSSAIGTSLAPYLIRVISKISIILSIALPSFFIALIIVFLLILINLKNKEHI